MLGWHPTRGWHVRRQQCLHTPAMCCDPGSPGGGPRHTLPPGPRGSEAQTRMRCAEIIDCADQRHPVLDCQHAACQGSASAGQRRQALSERRVEPLDGCRGDHPVALRATPERLDTCGRTIHDAALHSRNAVLPIALYDLGDGDMAPGLQPRTPLGTRMHRVAKRLASRSDVGAQPSSADQQRTVHGTAAHPLDQAPDQ